MELLLQSFLGKFDPRLLQKLLDLQSQLPPGSSPAARLALMAADSTAIHKLCQILARSQFIPREIRRLLIPLESLPLSLIPDSSLAAATRMAAIDGEFSAEKIGRGSVADVFRIRTRCQDLALKSLRTDSKIRVHKEVAILEELAGEADQTAAIVGPQFARFLREALKDAARALQGEINFRKEAENLTAARAFYRLNPRILVPQVFPFPTREAGPGVLMEYVAGTPLFECELSPHQRKEIARKLFRALILEPMFPGEKESIFHADPHAGNIHLCFDSAGEWKIILLDWSQASPLAAPTRWALVEFCLCAIQAQIPDADLLQHLLQSPISGEPKLTPSGATPLEQVFDWIEQLAISGAQVPLPLLLLRKAFMTLEGITRELNPDFEPWRETQLYVAWVLGSELPFRILSFFGPWMDLPQFYRTGLTTGSLLECIPKFVRSHNFRLTPPFRLCEVPDKEELPRRRQHRRQESQERAAKRKASRPFHR